MKKLIIIGVFFTSMLACKKEIKDIGLPASKVDGLTANWSLLQCTMVDDVSLTKESVKINSFFTASNGLTKLPNIRFLIQDGKRIYTVDTTNLSLNFFNSGSGTWNFDNDEFPSQIEFKPNTGNPITMLLSAPIRPFDNTLKLSKQVYCSGELKFTYVFEFERK